MNLLRSNSMRLLYINNDFIYPQDKHLVDGLREIGHEILEIRTKNKGYLETIKEIKKAVKDVDLLFIGFTSPILVILTRLLTFKKIFFNAVFSQYEANIISRGQGNAWSIQALKWYVLDFVSFHLSSKVLLESNAQVDFISSFFWISKKRLVCSYSGVDEKEFYYDEKVRKLPQFTVLFRGRFLPESGILTIIEAAKKLEKDNVDFRIIGGGFLYKKVNNLMSELRPKNVEMIDSNLSFEDLRIKMLECHLNLGQLADHPRLDRTLPCKLFESLSMKLPYLTAKNRGVLEVLTDGVDCITVKPGNSNDLSEKIIDLKNNPEKLDKIANAGYSLYKNKLTSKKLAEGVMKKCLE